MSFLTRPHHHATRRLSPSSSRTASPAHCTIGQPFLLTAMVWAPALAPVRFVQQAALASAVQVPHGDVAYLFELLAGGACHPDVLGARPVLDVAADLVTPRDQRLEQARDQQREWGDDVQPLREWPAVYEVFLALLQAGAALCGCPVGHRPHRRQDVGFRALIGEQEAQHRLDLEPRLGGLGSQPLAQRLPARRGDLVDGAGPPARGLAARLCPAERGQPLWFVVEHALGFRPAVGEAAAQLLVELVGGPRPEREHAEHGVGGSGDVGIGSGGSHPLTVLRYRSKTRNDYSGTGVVVARTWAKLRCGWRSP